MKHRRRTAIGTTCIAVAAISACSHTTNGEPVANSSALATSTSAPRSAPTKPSTRPSTTTSFEAPPFGVVPTTRVPIPAGAVTCPSPKKPAVAVAAKIDDPSAPIVTVAVPDGWGITRGTGDVGARLTGPDEMTATVTIATTKLDAAEAFRDYSDRLTSKYAISALSFIPGEMCDYSGQKLMGTLSNTSEDAIQFNDRIVGVWTNSKDYLVVVHVEAPAGVTDFDTISEKLTGDFEIAIP